MSYIKSKGLNWRSFGDESLLETEPRPTKTKQILDRIINGTRASVLYKEYPQMASQIKALRHLRPPRKHETRCLHIYGPIGTGKIKTVHRVLGSIESLDQELDYYDKMTQLTKFWDGYDNQPFVVIDEANEFNLKHISEEVGIFKNVISSGKQIIEIKQTSCQFDS